MRDDHGLCPKTAIKSRSSGANKIIERIKVSRPPYFVRLIRRAVNAVRSCTRPSSVTSTKYGTITETDLTIANFGVTLACASGYASGGTPTAACSSAGDYTVADPCTGVSSTALFV